MATILRILSLVARRSPRRRQVIHVPFYIKPTTIPRRGYASTYMLREKQVDSPFAAGDSSAVTSSDAENKLLKRLSKFVPRKAAVAMTDSAREFFRALLENNPNKSGVLLNFQQAASGEPRMVFSFSFVTKEELHPLDEGVSLELTDEGSPKSPSESKDDGLPKLYVHHNAFLKVLGATVEVDQENITPILYDREGNLMDPNA